MANNIQPTEGSLLDDSLVLQSVKYYAVIATGLGLLGVLLLLLFAGDDVGGTIIGNLLTLVILSFAVLSGPIIAAFVGDATDGSGMGDIEQRCINGGIANGAGFAVFGVIIVVFLWIGVTLLTGDGGIVITFEQLVTLIGLMILPNSLVGGAITYFSEDEVQTHHGSYSSSASSTPDENTEKD